VELKTLVIRSAIPEKMAEFYKHLGVTFEYHRHGKGPYHYSGHIGITLFEIYPLVVDQEKPDITIRMGLTIDPFHDIIGELKAQAITFHQEPKLTEWGIMAIIADPEGRKIELYKS
jgi:lactoylglutathione lyase